MTLTVHPGIFAGSVRAPGSKSVTHRALFLALVGKGGTVRDPLWSADTKATLHALQAFGAKVVATQGEAIVRDTDLVAAEVDAANSGTTLRLATGIAALCDGTSTLTGDDSLRRRPMGPLVEALGQLGAPARCLGDQGRPPVEVTGPAPGGHAKLPGDVSSQFISALLLVGPRLDEGVQVELATPLTSAPYVDLTIRMMNEVGLEVERTKNGFVVDRQPVRPVRIQVPGDYSAAAFPLVAGAITGGEVTVANLPKDSGQGDEALLDILATFGCSLEREADRVTLTGAALKAASVDLGDNPDLFPALAVLAALAPGKSVLHGAPHLKHKESDRIAAMAEGLAALGATIEPTDDGAAIEGGKLSGGTVATHGDHRIQMAFAVAALAADGPVRLEGPNDAHAVSYPGFLDDLRELGVEVERNNEEDSP